MSKKSAPDPPPAPDIDEMLETQARLNRVDTVSPYGSSRYSIGPDGRYTQTTEFSPELQPIFDAQMAQVRRGSPQFSYQQNPSIAAMSGRLFGGQGATPGSPGMAMSYPNQLGMQGGGMTAGMAMGGMPGMGGASPLAGYPGMGGMSKDPGVKPMPKPGANQNSPVAAMLSRLGGQEMLPPGAANKPPPGTRPPALRMERIDPRRAYLGLPPGLGMFP